MYKKEKTNQTLLFSNNSKKFTKEEIDIDSIFNENGKKKNFELKIKEKENKKIIEEATIYIAGVDEAGRGPVIGSLMIGCVVWEKSNEKLLEELGVDDSKRLTPNKRKKIQQLIKENAIDWKIIELSPETLNHLHSKGLTLNEIEELFFGKILNEIKPHPNEIYLDAADVKEERFGKSIKNFLKYKCDKIISKHKGDSIYKIVGAASIIAKYERDLVIENYKKKYGDIGSGYPSDPKTRKFLTKYYEKNGRFPPIVRTWWKTIDNIKKQVDNQVKKNSKKNKQKKLL